MHWRLNKAQCVLAVIYEQEARVPARGVVARAWQGGKVFWTVMSMNYAVFAFYVRLSVHLQEACCASVLDTANAAAARSSALLVLPV